MPPDLRTWTCGQCQRTILVPPRDAPDYPDTALRIREHRFGHMVGTLMHGSDEDLWGLSVDDSELSEAEGRCDFGEVAARVHDTVTRALNPPDPPVDSDDVAPVLEGIAELLRDDLPRARGVWYPINEDGSFNREED